MDAFDKDCCTKFKTKSHFSDEEIEAMDWSTKVTILKSNPVLVERQIDHIFQTVWKDVVMSSLSPVGEILNFDERGEFQSKTGTKHIHAILHIQDAPKIDDDDVEEVIQFIDNHITCALPHDVNHQHFHALVKKSSNASSYSDLQEK